MKNSSHDGASQPLPEHSRPVAGVAARAVSPALAIAGILLIATNLRMPMTSASPLLPRIKEDVGLSAASASFLISLPLLCFAVFSPIVPRIAARFGLAHSLFGALIAVNVGIVLRSWVGSFGLWAGTVLIGVGIAIMNVLLPALIKRDFPDHAGTLTGVYSAFQSLMAALAAAVAVPIAGLPGWGWQGALGLTLGAGLIGVAVFAPQVRADHVMRRAQILDRQATDAAGNPAAASAAASPAAVARPRSILRSPLAWVITAFMGFQSTLFYSVLAWWPAIEMSSGISEESAGFHIAVIQASGIVGSLVAGWLMKRDVVGSTVAVAVSTVIVVLVGTMLAPQLALLWALLIGTAQGGLFTVALTLFGARARTPMSAARLSGMAQTFGYVIAASVPPVLGVVREATGSWTASLWILLGIAVITLVSGLVSAKPRYVEEH
ncbi:CP family cyanate transporter-like MFS transporter [Pseudoglutamicibacter albus]|uniref:CP family cyanate transporter-like MFS transporter n=1 Tax=Pseudoglutamicibacter albus TaxID=98671 RepID=A0ABU1Z1F9_9MICC|nr:MFS transporter [Pseudoglutamicibacter albus]MDR7294446.1 CP family cyanate transporter-like MFS transporter [Pseudoglutamicibacter albus]